jgi:hypothetical protein
MTDTKTTTPASANDSCDRCGACHPGQSCHPMFATGYHPSDPATGYYPSDDGLVR